MYPRHYKMAPSKKPASNAKPAKTGEKDKAKGKANAASKPEQESGSKLKPATAINTRHILVRSLPSLPIYLHKPHAYLVWQCEKYSKKEEALTKLRDGAKFDDVAREFSEDKARQGGSLGWKVRGSLDAGYETAAYELEPSTTGNPSFVEVKSGHGYHIIMVEGRR